MSVVAYEGFVEDGRIRLPAGVLLPDGTRVYVIVPGVEAQHPVQIHSPRLADPAHAGRFEVQVITEKETNGDRLH